MVIMHIRKEKRPMKNAEVLNVIFLAINVLSGNLAGGALLANALYKLRFVGMIDG